MASFLSHRELNVQIFVDILFIYCEVLEVGEFFKPVSFPIALLANQGYRSPAHQRPLCPLEQFIERSNVHNGLPFLYFAYIYDIIFHSICNIELLAIPTLSYPPSDWAA